MHRARLDLEGPAEVQLGELDVLLGLLVPALDLDPRLEPDVESLDLLGDRTPLHTRHDGSRFPSERSQYPRRP
ncbi:hypothetical protein ACZ90_16345 [Streptomyces albus subsp. albus]|nr:hypothetical protein ACZ90_16345 [Streptomyces albus subsp. albus]